MGLGSVGWWWGGGVQSRMLGGWERGLRVNSKLDVGLSYHPRPLFLSSISSCDSRFIPDTARYFLSCCAHICSGPCAEPLAFLGRGRQHTTRKKETLSAQQQLEKYTSCFIALPGRVSASLTLLFWYWRELPQVSFLSRQTRVVLCRDKSMLVVTKLLSRQTY